MAASAPRAWRFFRAGGFDQVRLDSGADLLAIGDLDQKLWMALSCPTGGIEFDARTLALLDTDGDGRIRAPELIAATRWAGERLRDPELLAAGLPGLPLAAIRDDDEAGRRLAAAGHSLAAELGDARAELLSVDQIGVATERRQARLLAEWAARRAAAEPVGAATEAALAAVAAVRDKVEDYFARCRLVAFDGRAAEALNAGAEVYVALAGGTLAAESAAVAALPIATVAAARPLPLSVGANPAWVGRLAALRDLAVVPILGARDALDEDDWRALLDKLAPFAAWLAEKPGAAATESPESSEIADLERLARYVRDLLPLANNFVAFRDFYTRQGKATFQIGTLYLDGRSCELCVAVADPARHAALAGLSRVYLAYCDCRRGADTLTIAAAFTAGDSDQLMVGRNGVFYDRQGRDWQATIVRVVEHPISLGQAFWSPYRRFARLVAEQLQKVAGSRAKAVDERMAGTAAGLKAEEPKPVAQQAFDAGKFAGIFAAIGLAVGALGTAVASVVTGMLSLRWWQLPLAVAGIFLAISGPAVVIAWFKLRSRSLGPLLDANGWAINGRARINIPFGTALTAVARLPEGAERSLSDPYADKRPRWPWLLAALVIVAAALAWYLTRN